jgi:hypothetical protein
MMEQLMTDLYAGNLRNRLGPEKVRREARKMRACEFCEAYMATALCYVERELNPAQLGMVCSVGLSLADSGEQTSLYEAHCGPYLDKYASGIAILRLVAATTLLVRLYDLANR